jgi:hypothetical protein
MRAPCAAPQTQWRRHPNLEPGHHVRHFLHAVFIEQQHPERGYLGTRFVSGRNKRQKNTALFPTHLLLSAMHVCLNRFMAANLKRAKKNDRAARLLAPARFFAWSHRSSSFSSSNLPHIAPNSSSFNSATRVRYDKTCRSQSSSSSYLSGAVGNRATSGKAAALNNRGQEGRGAPALARIQRARCLRGLISRGLEAAGSIFQQLY